MAVCAIPTATLAVLAFRAWLSSCVIAIRSATGRRIASQHVEHQVTFIIALSDSQCFRAHVHFFIVGQSELAGDANVAAENADLVLLVVDRAGQIQQDGTDIRADPGAQDPRGGILRVGSCVLGTVGQAGEGHRTSHGPELLEQHCLGLGRC